MLEAEQQFRKIIGYRDLANLVIAIERDLTPPHPTQEAGHHARLPESTTGPPPKIHGARDILRRTR